jgi:hypothetical protein
MLRFGVAEELTFKEDTEELITFLETTHLAHVVAGVTVQMVYELIQH